MSSGGRVVIATDDLGDIGGVSTAIMHLTTGLRRRGIEVSFFSLHPPLPDARPSGRVFEIDRGLSATALHPQAVDFPGTWGLRLRAKTLLTPAWKRLRDLRLHREMARWGASDVVITMKPRVGEIVAEALRHREAHGRPRPQQLHQLHYEFDHWYRPLFDVAVRRIAGSGAQLVALWPADAELFAELYGHRVAAIPNAIDLDALTDARGTEEPEDPGRLVSISRLSPDKRVHLAVEAFDLALDTAPGRRLHIHGDGPDRPRVEAAIARLRHPGAVVLHGGLAPHEIPAALAGADLSVLVSEAEGLPMSILEASALGVPTVATRSSPAVTEIVGRHGYLCANDDPATIAATVVDALADRDGRQERARSGRAIARDLDVHVVADRWIALFARLRTEATVGGPPQP